mmetsp:Transcript_35191/g.109567  ORF Transcript_35191/g.109567 Transcript_35191/m.109567 type:complete len:342 (-) Transcript_35191:132-1157(-)
MRATCSERSTQEEAVRVATRSLCSGELSQREKFFLSSGKHDCMQQAASAPQGEAVGTATRALCSSELAVRGLSVQPLAQGDANQAGAHGEDGGIGTVDRDKECPGANGPLKERVRVMPRERRVGHGEPEKVAERLPSLLHAEDEQRLRRHGRPQALDAPVVRPKAVGPLLLAGDGRRPPRDEAAARPAGHLPPILHVGAPADQGEHRCPPEVFPIAPVPVCGAVADRDDHLRVGVPPEQVDNTLGPREVHDRVDAQAVDPLQSGLERLDAPALKVPHRRRGDRRGHVRAPPEGDPGVGALGVQGPVAELGERERQRLRARPRQPGTDDLQTAPRGLGLLGA